MNNDTHLPTKNKYFGYWLFLILSILICFYLTALLTLKPIDALAECLRQNYNDNRLLKIEYKDRTPIGSYQYSQLDGMLKYLSLPYIDVRFGHEMELDKGKVPIKKIYIVDGETPWLYPELGISDNKIYITDYMADMILNKNPLPLFEKRSYDDFIGTPIYFEGHYLEVGGVIRTGYVGSLFQKKSSIFENYYETAFITKNTFDTLLSFENMATTVSFHDDAGKGLFYQFYVKIVYDGSLEGNQVLISQDLSDIINENNFAVSNLDLNLYFLINRGSFTFPVDIKGVIDEENITKTIRIGNALKEDIYNNNKGFSSEFSMLLEHQKIPTYIHLRVIADKNLTGSNILVSEDMTAQGNIQLELYDYWRNHQYIKNFTVVGTIEDEIFDQPTIYVSQEVYDIFVDTLIQGGVITSLNQCNTDDIREMISILNSDGMYFQTQYKDSFIKLNRFGPKSIPLFIIILIIYLWTLFYFIITKAIETRRKHFWSIFKLTFVTIYLSYFIAFCLFILIPVNKIFEKIYYECLKYNLLYAALLSALFPLVALAITSIIFILIKKRKNKNLEPPAMNNEAIQ